MKKPLVQAAIDGTVEVMPSVTASVTTTIIAFAPMFFVSGVMGKFMAVIPFAVIAMLAISGTTKQQPRKSQPFGLHIAAIKTFES